MSQKFEEKESWKTSRMSQPAADANNLDGSGPRNSGADPYDDQDFHRTKRPARTREGKQEPAAQTGGTQGNNVEFVNNPDRTQQPEEAPVSRASQRNRAPDRERTLVSKVSRREGTQHPDGERSYRASRAAQESAPTRKYFDVPDSPLAKDFGFPSAKLKYFHDDARNDDDEGLCSEDEHDVKMLRRIRKARERRNLTTEELQYRLDTAETEGELRALVTEVERRKRVSKLIRFAGGDRSSEKNTRDMLVAAGWSRRK